jgi:acetate CoA/acetoacetate CoA-transferase alpha subunit
VIVEAESVVAQGGLEPEAVHTPGPFVDAVVHVPELTKDYAVVQR